MTSLSLSQNISSLFFEHLIFPHLQVCHIPYLCMVHHPNCMGQRMRYGDSRVPDSSWVHYHLSTHECLGNLDLGGRFRNTGSLIGLHHHLGSGKETAFPEYDQVQKVVVLWDEGVECKAIPDLEYPNLIGFPWLKVVFIE